MSSFPIWRNGRFDYIRCHVSQVGGITPAMKIARLGEFFNVKSGWHGPGDVSPVGHAAHCHIDLAIWNFGVQESVEFSERTMEVFPGCPQIKKGYLWVNEAPGLGVDVNEALLRNTRSTTTPASGRSAKGMEQSSGHEEYTACALLRDDLLDDGRDAGEGGAKKFGGGK